LQTKLKTNHAAQLGGGRRHREHGEPGEKRTIVGRPASEVDGKCAAHSLDRGLSHFKPGGRAARAPAQYEMQSCSPRTHFPGNGRNALTPHVAPDARISEEDLGGGITRVVINYGFSEAPDVPTALSALKGGFEPNGGELLPEPANPCAVPEAGHDAVARALVRNHGAQLTKPDVLFQTLR
jgi:hypothetical protein